MVRFLALLAVVTIAGCHDGPTSDSAAPAAVTVVSGNHQTGLAGTALEVPLVVRVTDTKGRPVSGVDVLFSVGTPPVVNSTVIPTNASGNAEASYVLGRNVGEQIVTATVSGVSKVATFTLTATPSPQ